MDPALIATRTYFAVDLDDDDFPDRLSSARAAPVFAAAEANGWVVEIEDLDWVHGRRRLWPRVAMPGADWHFNHWTPRGAATRVRYEVLRIDRIDP